MTVEMIDPARIGSISKVDLAFEEKSYWTSLPAGEYDITPEKWAKEDSNALNSYSLVVNEDGTGAVQMLPRSTNSGSTMVTSGEVGEFKTGGRTINLPQDQEVVVMAKPIENGLELQGMLRYTPGKSPVKDTPAFLTRAKNMAAEAASQFFDKIESPITEIEQAEELVVGDAIKRVKELDWEHFGNNLEIEEILEPFARLFLRNSGMNFAINSLVDFKPEDVAILETIPNSQKKMVGDGVWSVMLSESIDPEQAGFVRDWLYVKIPEAVASINKLDVTQVVEYFAKTDQSFFRAGERLLKKLARQQNLG